MNTDEARQERCYVCVSFFFMFHIIHDIVRIYQVFFFFFISFKSDRLFIMLSILYQGKISKTGALKEKNRTTFAKIYQKYIWFILQLILLIILGDSSKPFECTTK